MSKYDTKTGMHVEQHYIHALEINLDFNSNTKIQKLFMSLINNVEYWICTTIRQPMKNTSTFTHPIVNAMFIKSGVELKLLIIPIKITYARQD